MKYIHKIRSVILQNQAHRIQVINDKEVTHKLWKDHERSRVYMAAYSCFVFVPAFNLTPDSITDWDYDLALQSTDPNYCLFISDILKNWWSK